MQGQAERFALECLYFSSSEELIQWDLELQKEHAEVLKYQIYTMQYKWWGKAAHQIPKYEMNKNLIGTLKHHLQESQN